MEKRMKHLIIPDTQVKPGHPIDHLRWAGQYAVDKKPDGIIHIGDHFDMPSLSSWDVGKKSFAGIHVCLSKELLTEPFHTL